MTSNFKCLQLYNETFEQTFWIFSSREAYKGMCEELDLDDRPKDTSDGETVDIDVDGINVIALWYTNEDDLAHELEHAKNKMLGSRGVIADYDNDEVDSYVIGWLNRKIDRGVDYNGEDISSHYKDTE